MHKLSAKTHTIYLALLIAACSRSNLPEYDDHRKWLMMNYIRLNKIFLMLDSDRHIENIVTHGNEHQFRKIVKHSDGDYSRVEIQIDNSVSYINTLPEAAGSDIMYFNLEDKFSVGFGVGWDCGGRLCGISAVRYRDENTPPRISKCTGFSAMESRALCIKPLFREWYIQYELYQ